MTDIRWGLFGMLISNSIFLASVVLTDQREKLFMGCLLPFTPIIYCFVMFTSIRRMRYVQIPAEFKPYSKLNVYVVVIGMLHILGAIFFLNQSIRWPLECLLLFISSFVFSVDLYLSLILDTFILVNHPKEDDESIQKYIDRQEQFRLSLRILHFSTPLFIDSFDEEKHLKD
ncbi:hypothetical protein GCK72_006700 [Caenorhabditis remanei]|uniref:Uncharacterized protein n=1 Tax=Caenorhabditis remanei TaxID=31234 RepID=A0A6A5HLJ3_CAERE|nr:hypothetical protein GCK72_006700 [Caenorhabditis remanei]KAF1766742.1 hypothetical protein GCK72_006700 [Caenorhabditis remanei]